MKPNSWERSRDRSQNFGMRPRQGVWGHGQCYEAGAKISRPSLFVSDLQLASSLSAGNGNSDMWEKTSLPPPVSQPLCHWKNRKGRDLCMCLGVGIGFLSSVPWVTQYVARFCCCWADMSSPRRLKNYNYRGEPWNLTETVHDSLSQRTYRTCIVTVTSINNFHETIVCKTAVDISR